jgi:hypothetical protein
MKKEDKFTVSELRNRLLEVLTQHIGREKAIGMGELYEQVYGEPWQHRINDTRALRYLITDLRRRGVRICSVPYKGGGGYYLAAAGSELIDYVARLKVQGLRKLAQAAAIQQVGLPELLGQIKLTLEGQHDAA